MGLIVTADRPGRPCCSVPLFELRGKVEDDWIAELRVLPLVQAHANSSAHRERIHFAFVQQM